VAPCWRLGRPNFGKKHAVQRLRRLSQKQDTKYLPVYRFRQCKMAPWLFLRFPMRDKGTDGSLHPGCLTLAEALAVGIVAIALLSCNTKIQGDKLFRQAVIIYK
jgi:hypothetical protein